MNLEEKLIQMRFAFHSALAKRQGLRVPQSTILNYVRQYQDEREVLVKIKEYTERNLRFLPLYSNFKNLINYFK